MFRDENDVTAAMERIRRRYVDADDSDEDEVLVDSIVDHPSFNLIIGCVPEDTAARGAVWISLELVAPPKRMLAL